jgi:hypothetical protein
MADKTEKLIEEITKTKLSTEVEKALDNADGITEAERAALGAVVKILTPFRKSLSPKIVSDVAAAAGWKQEVVEPVAKGKKSEKALEDKDKEEAMKAAECAYKEHFKKLGHEQYPAMQIAQKAKETDDEEDEMDESVEKSLAKLPKESKAAVEAIFKQNEELRKSNESLAKQTEDLKNRVDAVTKAAKRGEFVKKAQSWDALGADVEALSNALMTVSELAPKEYESITKLLDAANEQVKKGGLFQELGSDQPGKGGNTWEKIEQAADAFVAKSGEKVSKAEAVDKFMQTRDGRAMYSEYMKEQERIKRDRGIN